MPLYASQFKLSHNGVIIVRHDEYMTTWPQFSGGQLVATVDRVGAASQRPFPRGNEFNTVDFGWVRQYETPDLAFAAAVAFPSTLYKGRASLGFQIENGTIYYIAEAAFTAWSARPEGNNVYFTLTAKGGAFG